MKRMLFIMFFCAASAFASPQGQFEAANKLFAEGKYAKAAAQYEKIKKENGMSASLLFNLANAQFKNKQIGSAILNLERAQFLKPNDPDIAANLRIVQNASGALSTELPWWKKMSYNFSSDTWALMTLFFGCAASGILIFLAIAKPSKLTQPLQIACGAFVLLTLAGIFGFMGRADDFDAAIVTASAATAKISPFDTAEVAFPLPEGQKVIIQKQHNGFTLIKNPLGKSAWASTDQIERIIP